MEQRTELEAELRLKEKVFELSIASLSTADPDGIINHVNQAFVEMWGYASKEDAIGGSVGSFFAREDDAIPVLEALQRTGRWEGEFVARRKDGTTFISRGLATTVLDERGEMIGYQSTNLDVTREREAEAKLKEVVRALGQSNQDLEQFAYVASHDLQEPLRMVASYTQLLAERYQGQLDEKADKFIGYAVDGAKRMQRLINDLLDYSRVGTRGEPLEPIESGPVVADVVSDLSWSIEQSGAQIVVEALPTVMADRSQLGQVFQNLMANSLKFRRAAVPRIEISARRRGPMWEFCVADNGIGIESQYHERIFLIFQRLHERGKYAGSGMGLAIAKKIVERHGGTIRVESAAGEGTRFIFTLSQHGETLEEGQ